jgi:PHS family inorganic phosphate transporter-like MFS transporter
MMASVFFAQPLGQLFAALVGLWVTLGQRDSSTVSMDKIWRIVSSVGALPAVVAIIFRFTITDPGRYTLDVQNEGERAVNDTDTHFGISRESLVSSAYEMVDGAQQEVHQEPIEQDEPLPDQFTYAGIKQYFYHEGNWRYLAGTSLCWFLLDFAFFGLGLNNPDTLADIWNEAPIGPMHQQLLNDAKRSLITVSIGSVLGIPVLITFIDRVSRRRILIHSFFGLGLLFIFTGMSYLLAMKHRAHILTIVLCSICEFVFNLGEYSQT